MTTPLSLTAARGADGAEVLVVAGEIDLTNSGAFAAAIADGLTRGAPLTVDLTAVAYLDSGALAVLFAHADDIRIRTRPLLVSVLTISGLAGLTAVEVVEDDRADG